MCSGIARWDAPTEFVVRSQWSVASCNRLRTTDYGLRTRTMGEADVKQSVQRQFGAVAANYATSPVHRGGPDLDAMLAAATPRGHERVLDAGCGTGHTALAFAPLVAEVVGADLTEAMLEQGRRLAAE